MLQNFQQDAATYLVPPFLKDSFREAYRLLEKEKISSVLDIGCASGDFIHFMPAEITATGVDMSRSLIEAAKSRVRRPNTQFIEADMLSGDALKALPAQVDAVTLLGVLHTVLDFRPLLQQAIALKPRLIVVHSPFNEVDVDAQHFHRLAGDTEYQCAYSITSMKTMRRYLNERGLARHEFTLFEMKSQLARNEANPLRNYHVRLENGERWLTNGIGMLFREYILVINP